MKKLNQIFLYIALIFTLAGCRVNNGDIGIYYGSWALDEVMIDGVADAEWCADGQWTTWSFQNDVIAIQRVSEMQDYESRWANWSEDNGKLLLDYRQSDNGNAAGTGLYKAPEWIYMEANTVIELNIDSQSSKAMTLTTQDSQGRKITYILRKIH